MTIRGEHVLVTGGAGFVGSHVTSTLQERGAEVTVLDNTFAGERQNVPEGVEFHEVDIRDKDTVLDVVEETDPSIIIHLAAIHYIPYCNENPEEAFDVNVVGTRNILEAARELSTLERIVYASTAAVYPPRSEPHAEMDETNPMDIYGRTKLVGEDLVELFATETGVPCVATRLFNVYGPTETNPHLIPAIVEQLDEDDDTHTVELGNLTPKRDFVYAGDVAEAIVTVAAEFEGEYRAYNVGTGDAYSVRGVVEEVSDALGEDIEITQDEERVRESDRPFLCADTKRIEQETSWKSETAFVDGLRELLKDHDLK
ncbi:NAD-dependent epimerase/dehydratase family protein [Salinigranum halophilum]|uniref:NAD-dependent epimerase/dehydratase family protein n=1 Tax=Salinigranum halophilum TaxID=2565931 RepID=UPI0010A87B82|nr:NAD-dependent epimerase/dehydratase family protein [Salinigranum halophilum]